ncbi:hypothetical protein M422DRAFT_38571 [Sphaerobolus stellatus SS14]|uniref:F-box domain-containing protein n=1 Tax=Sphaerobolus stellatus (strain SS14) TaxID=990650 RepID=A0A0C9UJT2_SPHS4|nr:hypothetical protein M422DRAFT_38571 [Sphaerobolus stellatus SS14]
MVPIINEIPIEILQYIFMFCIPPISQKAHENGRRSRVFEVDDPHPDAIRWKISTICHYWKSVLDSTATAWSTVVISPGEFVYEKVERQLKLSTTCLLDIYAKGYNPRFVYDDPFTKIFQPHVGRIGRLYCELDKFGCGYGSYILRAFSHQLGDTSDEIMELPNLQDISIIGEYSQTASPFPSPFLHRIHAPRLTQLLVSQTYEGQTFYEKLEDDSLTRIKLLYLGYHTGIPQRIHIFKLNKLVSLKSLIVSMEYPTQFPRWDPEETIPIPTLKYLRFECRCTTVASTFLSFLRVPNLEHLSINLQPVPRSFRPTITDVLESLAARPYPSLSRLTIERAGLLGNEFEENWACLQNVKHIHFMQCEFTPFWFHRVADKTASGNIAAPMMSDLFLQLCSFGVGDLVYYINKRNSLSAKGTVVKLERVKLLQSSLSQRDRRILRGFEKAYPGVIVFN